MEQEFVRLAHSNQAQGSVHSAEVKDWRGTIAQIVKIQDLYMKKRKEVYTSQNVEKIETNRS